MPSPSKFPILIFVILAVGATVALMRAAGFGHGIVLGAAPASAMALAAALRLRGVGAAAAGAGFALGDVVAGLPSAAALADGAIHGAAAFLAFRAMRLGARRRRARTFLSDWGLFIGGAGVATAVVSLGVWLAARAGAAGSTASPLELAALTLAFEPLGLVIFGAVFANLRELRATIRAWRATLAMAAVAAVLLAAFGQLLRFSFGGIMTGWVMIVLSMPLSVLVSIQPISLPGALVAALATLPALHMLLGETGTVASLDYVSAALSLLVVVASWQITHMVNRDRIAALAEVEARVRERTERLEAMTREAQEANEAKSRLLATVSHEIRTPLNGVLGMTAVVLTGPLEPVARRHVEVIRASGFHLLTVVNRILDFSRLGNGSVELDPEPFDLRDLAEEVLREASFLPFAQGLELRAEISPSLVRRRMGPRGALRQVLTNLVANACRFTDRGGVVLRARDLPGGMLRIEVEDTGLGVPAEAQDRIFRPFEQAGERRGGTGLGLAICAEVVERMGGRIGVRSAPGEGALFWIEAPVPEDEPIPLALRA